MKRAFITGIAGQAGSALAAHLLDEGYDVHGLLRRSSSAESALWRLSAIKSKLHLHDGDLCDSSSLMRIVREVRPEETYHLGAQSHVRVSFDQPEYTGDVVALGTLRLLEALRQTGVRTRLYNGSTSEMFGSSPPPQNEYTPFHPRSPYGVAKLAAHYYAVNYRESYGMFNCCGLLFNMEGPTRGDQFVTRKITIGAARIKLGIQDRLVLGNLDASRDWGYVGDYVRGMRLMLQQDVPDDYVLATGEVHTVEEFVAAAFARLDLDWKRYVDVDDRLKRPAEVHALCGDASKARQILHWEPTVTFNGLVDMMVDADFARERAASGVAGAVAR